MNTANLDTTNLLLGILAAVSVLQVLLLIGLGVMAYRLYTRAMEAVRDIESRQIAPFVTRADGVMTRLDAVLIDLKQITGRVTNGTERMDTAIRNTIDRVDETAGRVRSSVSSRILQVLTLVQTARAAVDGFFHNSRRAEHIRT
jgi:hypothetical protein